MPFPERLIEQIRQRTDLVELVSEVVPLKRVGKNYAGLCPFHAEDTPSFYVHPDWGIFKCFGCGKGGNAITFVMEYYRMSFPEAVRFLAERAGIELPEEPTEERELSHTQQLYRALQAAARLYHSLLFSPAGTTAYRYALGRGLSEQTLRQFQLGYAPNAWDTVLTELRRQGFSEALLLEAGLLVRSEQGTLYDRFRDRLIFPIHDTIGRVVGFGARRLREEEPTPKYINSPATPLYDKSKLLYGLYHARHALRSNGYALLVEGYMDALALHQAGLDTAVATAGTALSRDQLRLLRRYCQQLFVVYDADSAGQQATLRALELALAEGFDVRIVVLPAGEDPASFLQSQGKEAFLMRLRSAVPFLEFVLLEYQRRGALDTPEGQVQAVRHAVRLIATIPDRLLHEFLLRRLAARFALPESLLYAELQAVGANQSSTASPSPPPRPSTEAAAPAPSPLKELLTEEREILRALLLQPHLRHQLQPGEPESVLLSERARQLWQLIQELTQRYAEPVLTIAADPQLQQSTEGQLLLELAIVQQSPSPRWLEYVQEFRELDWGAVLRENLLRLRLRGIEQRLQQLRAAQAQAQSWTQQQQLLHQIQELLDERLRCQQQLEHR
jgi:DNA primase